MKQWYAKELSNLTKVSVRTLHYYDKRGLLKPSLRLDNGYRVYSESDLLKLQQILALKFFGFELSKIKYLLSNHGDVLEQFSFQSKFLEEKAQALSHASSILKRLTSECKDNKTIHWQKIVELIGVYRMSQELENKWVASIFTPEELIQYAKFEADLEAKSTPADKEIFQNNWFQLVNEIKQNLSNSPSSQIGITLGRRCVDLIFKLYGKEHANLRTAIWEKGFKQGKNLNDHGLTPQVVAWLDQAMDAYWRERIYGLLQRVNTIPSSELLSLWQQLLDEMYGNDNQSKSSVSQAALRDDNVSQAAKEWLRKSLV